MYAAVRIACSSVRKVKSKKSLSIVSSDKLKKITVELSRRRKGVVTTVRFILSSTKEEGGRVFFL